jgi:hypothetical protein
LSSRRYSGPPSRVESTTVDRPFPVFLLLTRRHGTGRASALHCIHVDAKETIVRIKPVWKIDINDEAPDFELLATGATAGKGQPNKRIRLSEYRGSKNVMLAFYPAAFTPV